MYSPAAWDVLSSVTPTATHIMSDQKDQRKIPPNGEGHCHRVGHKNTRAVIRALPFVPILLRSSATCCGVRLAHWAARKNVSQARTTFFRPSALTPCVALTRATSSINWPYGNNHHRCENKAGRPSPATEQHSCRNQASVMTRANRPTSDVQDSTYGLGAGHWGETVRVGARGLTWRGATRKPNSMAIRSRNPACVNRDAMAISPTRVPSGSSSLKWYPLIPAPQRRREQSNARLPRPRKAHLHVKTHDAHGEARACGV